MNVRELVRWYKPDATDKECDYILWNCTGFPQFWRTSTPVIECRLQIRQALGLSR